MLPFGKQMLLLLDDAESRRRTSCTQNSPATHGNRWSIDRWCRRPSACSSHRGISTAHGHGSGLSTQTCFCPAPCLAGSTNVPDVTHGSSRSPGGIKPIAPIERWDRPLHVQIFKTALATLAACLFSCSHFDTNFLGYHPGF